MAFDEWHSAIWGMIGTVAVAAAALTGGMIERFWLSADVERQTDVQFVSIAAGT